MTRETTATISRLRGNARFLFLVRFLLVITVLYVVLAVRIVDERVVTPFSRGITTISAVALNTIGQEVVWNGTIITNGRFAVNVKNGCNGLEALLIVVSGIVSFPARWRDRLLGLVLLVAAVQFFNVVRVASLYVIGRDYPRFFDAAHITLWQSVMVLFSIGAFTLWSSWVSKRREVAG